MLYLRSYFLINNRILIYSFIDFSQLKNFMTMKFFLAVLITIFFTKLTFAQDFGGPKKGSAIGFSGNLIDFSASIPKVGKVEPGFSLMYWHGLSKHIDYSIRYNGLFTDYSKNVNIQNKYTNEFEGSLHARLLENNHLFNPFATAGIGVGSYGKGVWAPYVPLGVGLQVNLNNEGYLFLQGNYRATLASLKLDNNAFYALGFTQSIRSTEAFVPAPLPVVPIVPVVVDRDNDGVPDSLDACPDVAGLAAFKGCPDTDGDGIADTDDKCPTIKGLAKYNGCPIPDTDGDGINDEEDKCPTVAGVARYQGCPVPDTDGDGVNDEEDKCPTEKGTAENHGCPVLADYAFNADNVQFISGSANLTAKARTELGKAVAILKEHAGLNVKINGYTDNIGKPATNLVLSQKRANLVKAYLVKKGISTDRLTATGFGIENPVTDNKTAAGRTKNRRVEFVGNN